MILIFDLTNRGSFDRLNSWLEDISAYGPKDVSIMIIGNKSDLSDERKTSFNEAFNFANKNGLSYMEVSAKTGNNVGLLFENLTKTMVKVEVEKDKLRKKKGKIDKSHVTANKSIQLEHSMKLIDKKEASSKNDSGCCK